MIKNALTYSSVLSYLYLLGLSLISIRSLNSQIIIPSESIRDSIISQLENPLSQIDEIDLLLGLSRYYMLNGGPDKAKETNERALRLAKRINSKYWKANTLSFIAMLKRTTGEEHCPSQLQSREVALQSKNKDAILFATYPWVERCLYDTDKGIKILEEMISWEKSVSRKNFGNLFKTLGWQYELAGRFEEAEKANLRAIEIFKEINESPEVDPDLGRPSAQLYDRGITNLLQTTLYNGQLYLAIGRYDEAIKYGQQAYAYAEKASISDKAWIANNLGQIYHEGGEYERAISLYKISSTEYQKLNEPGFHSATLLNLGNLYNTLGDHAAAITTLRRSYEMVKYSPNDAAEVLVELGTSYKQLGDTEESIHAFLMADSLYEVNGNQISQIKCKLAIADIQVNDGAIENAQGIVYEQIPIAEKAKSIDMLHAIYYRLASISSAQQNYPEAMRWSKQALEIITSNNLNISSIYSSYKQLSTLYSLTGDHENAYKNLTIANTYADSIFKLDVAKELKSEQVKQNVEDYKKNLVKSEQKAQLLSKQNRFYLIGGLGLLTLLSILSYLFVQLRKTRHLLESQNQQLQELNHTKDRFFGIIAHDIRSPIIALESVDEQIAFYVKKGDTNKVEKLSSMVSNTSRQLNNLLDNLLNWALLQTGVIPYHPQHITVCETVDEVIAILETNAISKQIEVINHVKDNQLVYVDPNAFQTILRNVLSNALKFTKKGGTVSLDSSENEKFIDICIIDTGVGMSKEQVNRIFSLEKKSNKGTRGERGTGLGMILVKELVDLNKGYCTISSEIGKGTAITIGFLKSDQI